MPSYLTFAQYKLGTTIKGGLVDLCGQAKVEEWLDRQSNKICNRLVKRYAVNFTDPGPVAGQIKDWLTILVDINVLKFTGGVPDGREDEWASNDLKTVNDELKEAADSEKGLFELPLRNTDISGSAVNVCAPLGYSEQSPYTWTDRQRDHIANGGT